MAREHKVSESNSILVQTREYTGALRRLAQKSTTIEKARPPAWEPPNYSWSKGELHVVDGITDLHVEVVGNGDLLLLGSNVDCSGRSGKTIKGKIKQA